MTVHAASNSDFAEKDCPPQAATATQAAGQPATTYLAATSPRPLLGSLRVPSDKSLSHRVALFAAAAQGTSQVRGLLPSQDVHSTLAAIAALGARVDLHQEPDGLAGSITGWGAAGPTPQLPASDATLPSAPDATQPSAQTDTITIDCGNSGTTVRLLMGLLAGYDISVIFTGDASLQKRPMRRVALPLARMGAVISPPVPRCLACGDLDKLPLKLRGSSQLRAIDYTTPVASAQIKSAILLAGLHARGSTTVREPAKSRDHTELLLPAFGVAVQTDGLAASITGGQQLQAANCAVPADPSSAAFLLVAAALTPGSRLELHDVLLNPTRTGFLRVMQRMQASIGVQAGTGKSLGAEQTGCIVASYSPGLVATTVSAAEIPSLIDEVPILALLATAACGTTRFEQVGELRVKESNRLAAIVAGLTALGFTAREEGDDLLVQGAGGQVGSHPQFSAKIKMASHGDHRLAMTWAIAGRAWGLPVQLDDVACIDVSYPGFFAQLEALSAGAASLGASSKDVR